MQLVKFVTLFLVNCSFPFTYDGGLYYRCIENMAGISTPEQPFACIGVNASHTFCNDPGW